MLCQKHLCCSFKFCHQLLSLEIGQLHEYHFYRPCIRFYCGISICFLLLFFVHFYHYLLYPTPSLGLPLVCPLLSLWNRFSSDFHSTFNPSSSFLFSPHLVVFPVSSPSFYLQYLHTNTYMHIETFHIYTHSHVYTHTYKLTFIYIWTYKYTDILS